MSLQDNVRKFNEYDAKTNLMEIKLKAMEVKYNKRYNSNSWVEKLLHPFAKEMVVYLGKAKWEIMGPFGLRCYTSVWFYDTEQQRKECKVLSITFSPDYNDIDNPCGLTIKDETINTDKFEKNSIGAINGFNHPCITPPVDADLKWFAQYIK